MGKSVNIDEITIAVIVYKVYVCIYCIYLEPQDISCIGFFLFLFWINLQTDVETEVVPLCKVCFPWFDVTGEQTLTKALD